MSGYGKSIVGLSCCWLALAWLAGCASVPASSGSGGPGGPERIGTLRVLGSEVFRNDHRASSGEGLYVGDHLRTGRDSTVIVEAPEGEVLQLDENTDPEFSFSLVPGDRGRRCLHIRISIGRMLVNRDLTCVDTPNARVVMYSTVVFRVSQSSTTITVLRGKAEITDPAPLALSAGEEVTVQGGRIGEVRKLGDLELKRIVQFWALLRRGEGSSLPDTDRPGWCCDERSGKAYPADAKACYGKGLAFFKTAEEAWQHCKAVAAPPAEIYCCTREMLVKRMTEAECKRNGGTPYKTQQEAERDKRCFIE